MKSNALNIMEYDGCYGHFSAQEGTIDPKEDYLTPEQIGALDAERRLHQDWSTRSPEEKNGYSE